MLSFTSSPPSFGSPSFRIELRHRGIAQEKGKAFYVSDLDSLASFESLLVHLV